MHQVQTVVAVEDLLLHKEGDKRVLPVDEDGELEIGVDDEHDHHQYGQAGAVQRRGLDLALKVERRDRLLEEVNQLQQLPRVRLNVR